jgi:signal-transduction protein with cAMP-binding, CBS, and nucleotidyltransferase domain
MTEKTEAGLTPISVVVTDAVIRVEPNTSVIDVARAMTDASVGLLVVGHGDEVAGVVSERDVVSALARGRDPETTTASEIAQVELVWCELTSTVAEVAVEMMEHYVRHILVEADGRLVGIVSARDVLGVYAATAR